MLKKFLIFSFLISFASDMVAQTMIVHLKDGKQISYAINDVDSVEIQAPSDATANPFGADLRGTAGDAVDLGLSVNWASHNLGAYEATDCGETFSFNDATMKASVWGTDWRLPTDAEWEELYQNCTWSWTVRNGIGGRIITAKNGNSIFIPATGFTFDGTVSIRGCIGLYWTSDATRATAESAPEMATGAYFDSANIYRIDYPVTNTLSVRLVKK